MFAVDQGSAAGTVGLVGVVAALTERCAVRPGIYIGPNAVAAADAEGGLLAEAVEAEVLTVKEGALAKGLQFSAVVADKGSWGVHGNSS